MFVMIVLGNPVSFTPPFGITNILSFIISSKDNKFIAVGCSTFGYLTIYSNTSGSIVGCITQCHNMSMAIDEGHCSSNGCCKVDIPTGMTTATIQVATYLYCSYSFVVKNGYYSFSNDHLENLPYQMFPVVFDWSVGNETCKESLSRGTNACKGNSTCVEAESGYGYRCQCNQGFEGNPYLHACTGN
ncbi:Wall-associated receptor kinase [Arachis hypogaea]|nr:Wall-associated receptor kinase [Arachis hypogaea]